jgi:hypothetical protein
MLPRHPLLFALLLACPSVQTPVATPPTRGEAPVSPLTAPELPTLTPVDLRVMHGDRLEAQLAADGAITVDGAAFARMEGERVVAGDGRVLAALEAGGAIRFAGATRAGRLLTEGVVEGPDGQRMALRDDGHVEFTDPAHPGDHVTLQTRVEGVTERSRREAVVLMGVLMFRARALAAGR